MNQLQRLLRRAVSIRVRLTLWYVALLAVILVVFSGLLYFSLARSLSQEMDLTLATEASRQIASMDVENGALHLGEGPDNLSIGTVAELYDATGRYVLAYDTRQPLPAVPEALSAAASGASVYTTTALPDGIEWRVLTAPVIENGVVIAILQVGRPVAEVNATLHSLALLLALAVPFTLVVASAGGLFLAGRALDPIDYMTRAAAAIGANDLSRRLGFRGRDEVGRLAATFDGMLDRLDRAFQRQRQFTADASHELRTPLTMLSSQIDVALQRTRTPAEYKELLRSLRDDAARMSRLVNELLTLARADAGQQLLTREKLDLDELVGSVVAAMQPLATQQGVQLTESTTPAPVLGDQTRLTQLLMNLVDNALRYTPAGGSVTVTVRANSDSTELRVADTGSGIAPEHLPHLFERFYRGDLARARSEGGAGLGLAIAQWIVEAHGGRIGVESEVGRGSVFKVSLPSAASGPGADTSTPAQMSLVQSTR